MAGKLLLAHPEEASVLGRREGSVKQGAEAKGEKHLVHHGGGGLEGDLMGQTVGGIHEETGHWAAVATRRDSL